MHFKSKKASLLIVIVIIVILAIGGGAYFYTRNKSQSNSSTDTRDVSDQSTTDGATTTSKPDESLQDIDLVGWWTPSLAGDEEMVFYVDKGIHHYSSYLQERPSYSGTWALVDNMLTVTYDVPGMEPDIFTVAARQSDSMQLKDAEGKESTYVFKGDF